MAMLIRGQGEKRSVLLLLLAPIVDRAARAAGCTKLLLKDAEGTTNARAKPAMQARETRTRISTVVAGTCLLRWSRLAASR